MSYRLSKKGHFFGTEIVLNGYSPPKDSEAVDLLIVEKIAAVEKKEEEQEDEDLLDLDDEAKEKLSKVVSTLRRGSLMAK